MIYEICIEGEFQNIQGVSADQRFSVHLKCTSCDLMHKKNVVVTRESTKAKDGTGKFNLIVGCRDCKKSMKLRLIPPKMESTECIDPRSGSLCSADLFPGEHRKEGFVISRLEAVGCWVTEVDPPSIDVISVNNVLFKDIDLEGNSWAGAFRESFSSIEMLVHRLSWIK